MPFKIIRNDITKMKVDVIVNSANPNPVIGGGVDFAIHEAGGKKLVEARIQLGPISIGDVIGKTDSDVEVTMFDSSWSTMPIGSKSFLALLPPSRKWLNFIE